MTSAGRASRGRVEDLLTDVNSVDGAAAIGTHYELWVPDALTLRDQPAPLDLAMAILLHALLAKGYYPAGFEADTGGRVYRYVREG